MRHTKIFMTITAKPRPMINVILQFLELDLVTINVSAKFYQNILNGFKS